MADTPLLDEEDITRALAFRTILELPEDKLLIINNWIKSHLDMFFEGEIDSVELQILADGIGIPREEILSALALAVSFFFHEGSEGIPDSDRMEQFIDSLKSTGIKKDTAEKAKILLSGISPSSKEVLYQQQRAFFVRAVIPTLENVDAFCDLRAIFRASPSGQVSKEYEERMEELLGFEPVVLVSLELNDSAENDIAYTFQLTEKGLRHLLKTLEQSLAQLEIIKKKSQGLLS